MEFVILTIALAMFMAVVFFMEYRRAKQLEKKFIHALYNNADRLLEKEYRPEYFRRINKYFLRHRSTSELDDITWNDLGMDEVFKRINYTLSSAGEEFLYYSLRTLKQSKEEVAYFHSLVECFTEDKDRRVKFQLQMDRLGHTGKYSLYDYIDNLDVLGARSNTKNIVCDLLFLPLICMLWINFSVGIIGLVILMLYNIISYFKEKNEIDAYITSFAYLLRLLKICENLETMKLPGCEAECEKIRTGVKNLRSLQRGSFLVMWGNRIGTTSADFVSILFDYIRMVFHADLIKFNNMLKTIREKTDDVDMLIGSIGLLETAVAVCLYRESLKGEYALPQFTEEKSISVTDAYHPLIPEAVKNSVTTRAGVLLTGSNASGKSTFLKTVAINSIFAQTIGICTAKEYQAPFFQIYSSMALKDDLQNGESYYIVEIKSLKRILDAAKERNQPVLCFVDEVLRGTNTVERIAASTQILKSLAGNSILCFAATHDIELTGLLKEVYDNYHFEEEVLEGDIKFNYCLKTGKATTRNAIRLLELLGYDKELITDANQLAEHFLITGEWK